MAKVFVLNKGSHDYTEALKYGELVYCTEGTIAKWNTSQMMRECSAAMADSVSEDYILLTSLSILCSIACALFVHKHGKLNLLIFKDNSYVPRNIVFD